MRQIQYLQFTENSHFQTRKKKFAFNTQVSTHKFTRNTKKLVLKSLIYAQHTNSLSCRNKFALNKNTCIVQNNFVSINCSFTSTNSHSEVQFLIHKYNSRLDRSQEHFRVKPATTCNFNVCNHKPCLHDTN